MRELALVALSAVLMATPSPTQVQPFPAGFKTQTIATNGTRIFVRVGGHGPAVGLLHRLWETGDMGAPPAARLVHDHTLIRPDPRRMGPSPHPGRGHHTK